MEAKDYIGQIVLVKMDRPLGTKHPKHGFVYPVNYGFIPNTVSVEFFKHNKKNWQMNILILVITYVFSIILGQLLNIFI